MPKTSPVRVLVVGLGAMGVSHARAYAAIRDSRSPAFARGGPRSGTTLPPNSPARRATTISTTRSRG